MQYKVIISERARDMLGAHVRFLAQVNKPAAQKLKTRLIEALRSLETMPQKYPFFNEEYITPNKYRKMYVENWFVVLYQIRDEAVYVDWILDGRQDAERIIK